MTVSIIICTRDRAESLKLTMESIGKATVPSTWTAELLIVDNGSSDATEATVSSTALPNMPVRYVQEPRKGKGHAYSIGIASAHAQTLLFTDDDIRVPAAWIEGMCKPILDGSADAVAGGVAFPASLAGILAQAPFSTRRGWLASTEEIDKTSPTRMVGANMAFGRHVLDRVPAFDVELGPGALGFFDETLFSYQLIGAAYKLAGALDIVVEHHFDPSRLSQQGMIDVARKMGRSYAYVYHHWFHRSSRLALPRLVLNQLFRLWLRGLDCFGNHRNAALADRLLQAHWQMSFYREYLAQRRRPCKYPSPGCAPKYRARPLVVPAN